MWHYSSASNTGDNGFAMSVMGNFSSLILISAGYLVIISWY